MSAVMSKGTPCRHVTFAECRDLFIRAKEEPLLALFEVQNCNYIAVYKLACEMPEECSMRRFAKLLRERYRWAPSEHWLAGVWLPNMLRLVQQSNKVTN